MIAAKPISDARSDTDLHPDDELLTESARTRVVRRPMPGGSIILKELLGRNAFARKRHETVILKRLEALAGVAKLASIEYGPTTIALRDHGGTHLSTVLGKERLGIDEVLAIVRTLARTLAQVHELGIVHRDVNPSAVLVTGIERTPTLIGFDLASSFAEERPAFGAQTEIQGTLAYIAPEQTGRTGRVMDQRADLYSLGATMYEMLVGRPPFDAADPFQLICDHLSRTATPPAEIDRRIPEAISEIVVRLLQKEPDRRYQSAEGLAADIGRVIAMRERGSSVAFALGEDDFPQRLLPPSRLIGRDAEITALDAALQRSIAGKNGTVLVAGAPGVGKTALINGLRSRVAAKGGWFVSGKFDQNGLNGGSNAVRRVFADVFRMLLAEPEETLAPLRTELRRVLGERLAILCAIIPEIGMLLQVPETNGNTESLGPWAGALALALLKAIVSRTRPLVIFIDDLQWGSATPIDFIDTAVNDSDTPGLLLVVAYRTAEIVPTHPIAPLLERWAAMPVPPPTLHLGNLATRDLDALLGEMLRLPPARAAELSEIVAERTAGNPYDSVELINALRRDGALIHAADGWHWDARTVRRFIGAGDVIEFLQTRLARLPSDSRTLVTTMAYLGGEIELRLLQAASGFDEIELEARLLPALDDGLIVVRYGAENFVRFRHDRVQQAAYDSTPPGDAPALHHTIARRVAERSEYITWAAEQYARCSDRVRDEGELETAGAVLRSAASAALRFANFDAVVRYMFAARTLRERSSADDHATRRVEETLLHHALYGLGRLEDADLVFASIVRGGGDPLELANATCEQISSLTNRHMFGEALAIGVDLLTRIGIDETDWDRLAESVEGRFDEIATWYERERSRPPDSPAPEADDARVIAAGRVLSRMSAPAYFSDHPLFGWVILESLRLWSSYGSHAAFIGPLSHAGFMTIRRGEYRLGYAIARYVLELSERKGYVVESGHARFLFALAMAHWFEPIEASVEQARTAREELIRGGDVMNACHTYYASIPQLLHCATNLEEVEREVEGAIAFCARTGNSNATTMFAPYRQFVRTMRGETRTAGGFDDGTFDESTYAAGSDIDVSSIYFHIARALSACIFDDDAALARHIGVAMRNLGKIWPMSSAALAHWLHAIATARRLRNASADERARLLEEVDRSHAWLSERANDTPGSYLHSVRLIEAERAWALDDFPGAARAFEASLQAVAKNRSSRHRAFVAERAGRFYLEYGMERYAHLLLCDARELYAAWGAPAKAAQLDARYPVVAKSHRGDGSRNGDSAAVSSDAFDTVAIVRASQALSSQTNLDGLTAKLFEVLAALTGATAVRLVFRRDAASDDWSLAGDGPNATPVPVGEAGELGRLPLSVFRYVERTRETLLVADAKRDDRFARDAYFEPFERCSILVVPIVSHGVFRAVLMLENDLGSDAFSDGRLDVVHLITGQLAVSLENALLYASLEEKVARRTAALAAANEQLAELSLTDSLTGILNRRGLERALATECRRGQRDGLPIGLLMIDIDQFKAYNDTYGHIAGDACLHAVAQALGTNLRGDTDVIARYGGEEFVAVLPGADLAEAHVVAERLRASVEALRERHEGSTHGRITVSIGASAFRASRDADIASSLATADAALYDAKDGGRNRVA